MNATNGLPVTKLEERVAKLEDDLALMCWLYAELIYGLRLAAVTQYVQSLQPQVQQALVDQIMAAETT